MNIIGVRRLGFAVGTTMALLYLGCMLVMWFTGEATTVRYFNSLLHGLDVSTIIRHDVPLSEAAMGIVQTFVLGWLIGASIAAIYNVSSSKR
ncbi:DUF5676 family membrane protein [Gilvimarinus sp. F26214L]|uniref:DUF5676 family membrane protein n=1 Tax=Gilvimarinus sp. DZF01 TaxID=3461371 RepID=UPI0040463785